MSALLLPSRLKKQPQYVPQIDNQGVASKVRFALLGNIPRELRLGIERTGTIGTREITPTGIAYVPASTATTWAATIPSLDPAVSGSFTVAWSGYIRANTVQNLLRSSAGYGWRFETSNWSTDRIVFRLIAAFSGLAYNTANVGVVDNSFHTVAVRYDDDAAIAEIFLDGASIGSGSFTKDATAMGSGQVFSITGHATLPHKMLSCQGCAGKLSDAEIRWQAENPFGIFKSSPRRLWAASGGVAHALEGSASADAAATGELVTQIKLVSAALSTATATGTLTTQISLVGSASSIAQAVAALSTQITLGGNAAAQAGANGALATAIPLAGPASAGAAATGALATQIRLGGTAVVQAIASGDLTAGGALAGPATASSVASGTLTAQIKLDGAAVAAAVAAAGLSTQIKLGGGASTAATVIATLTTSIQLAGNALAASGAIGTLVTAIPLTADALATVIATGELTVPILLAGSASAVASATGQLSGLNPEYNPRYAVRATARNFSASHTKQYVARYGAHAQ